MDGYFFRILKFIKFTLIKLFKDLVKYRKLIYKNYLELDKKKVDDAIRLQIKKSPT